MGNYQKGAEILVRLFIQTRDAAYLYNQGRCYQQNHRWAEAIDRFREYLRKGPDLNKRAKREAREQIAECEANLSKETAIPQPSSEPESGQGKPASKLLLVPTGEGADSPAPSTAAQATARSPSPAGVPEAAAPSENRVDLTQTASPSGESHNESSIFSRWWFWTGVGAVVAGGIVTAVLLATGKKGRFCSDCNETAGIQPQ